MKPQSEAICNKYSTERGICHDVCPLKEPCNFQDGDSYQVWEIRMEKAAIDFNMEKEDEQ